MITKLKEIFAKIDAYYKKIEESEKQKNNFINCDQSNHINESRVNPESGMPIFGNSSVDIAGNAIGSDFNHN